LPAVVMAGSINGYVTAADGGDAVEGLWVKAYNYATKIESTDETAGDGSYNITGLFPGNYRVYVDTFGTDYIREYYNNTYREGSATPVKIDAGGTVTINFSLDEGREIKGTVTDDSGGSPITGIMLVAKDFNTNEWMRWANSDAAGKYRIQGLSPGSYRVEAGGGGYAKEIYDNHYYPSQATAVNVTSGSDTAGIDFRLDQGGTITGTLFESNGTTPVTGTQVEVEVLAGDPCGDVEWLTNTGSSTIDGAYEIQGIPPIDVYVRADENYGGNDHYISEWWASGGSSWDCSDAEELTIVSGVTTSGINLQLDSGGSISGIVEGSDGAFLYNVDVSYENDYHGRYITVKTGPDGSFKFSNLPPGPAEIYIRPETQLGLVHHIRKYWLEQGQDRDLETIRLVRGALLTGRIQDQAAAALAHTDLDLVSDYTISQDETLADGSYTFRVPIGYSAINMSDDKYHMVPERVQVTSANQTIDLGASTAYNDAACDPVSGSITESAPHNGQLIVLAFPDGIQYSDREWDGVDPISFAIPSGDSYSLFVPPGEDVTIICGLITEDIYGRQSVTIADTTTGVSPPASGVNFSYSSEGTTVRGYIKDKTGYLFNARAVLFKRGTGDDEFAGMAETDQNGKFEIYNIQPGPYQLHAVYYDNMHGKSSAFTVGASPATVPDITVRSKASITQLLELLLLYN